MSTTIQLLGNKDVFKKGDWCRPLYLCTMSGGHSDDYSFSGMGGAPENNTKWCRVERIMPAWIGSTVGKYNKRMEEFNEWEFVRGRVPKSHIHKNAEAPDYNPKAYDYMKENS